MIHDRYGRTAFGRALRFIEYLIANRNIREECAQRKDAASAVSGDSSVECTIGTRAKMSEIMVR
eukprot:COSAG02_NODE_20637_length_821_cov_1.779778_2_plen_63_part_01